MIASTTTTPPRTKPRKPIPPLSSAMTPLLLYSASNAARPLLFRLVGRQRHPLRRLGRIVELQPALQVITYHQESDQRHHEGHAAKQKTQHAEAAFVRHVQSAIR